MMDAAALWSNLRASEIISKLARFRRLANHDLPTVHALSDVDLSLAVPLQKARISCRELMHGEVHLKAVAADGPVRIDDIDSPCAHTKQLIALFYSRGLRP